MSGRRVQAALEVELDQEIVADQGCRNQHRHQPDGSGLLEVFPKCGEERIPNPAAGILGQVQHHFVGCRNGRAGSHHRQTAEDAQEIGQNDVSQGGQKLNQGIVVVKQVFHKCGPPSLCLVKPVVNLLLQCTLQTGDSG